MKIEKLVPIIRYLLERQETTRIVPGGAEVHYMHYQIREEEIVFHQGKPYTGGRSPRWTPFAFIEVPCRARLHHAMTGLFWEWNWKDHSQKEISREEADVLKHVFSSRKEYKLWKQTLEKINNVGAEKAKKWLVDQVKVLVMRKVMKGE